MPRPVVCAASVGAAWEEAVHLLLTTDGQAVVDSTTAGPTIELQNVLICVDEPDSEPSISQRYPLRDLIEDYGSVLERPKSRRGRDMITVADRIYRWPAGAKHLDQLRLATEQLRRDPNSRRSLVQIWNPVEDLSPAQGSNPSGHCCLQFLVRDNSLHLTVFGRSVDAWNAALPNMATFVGLQKAAAGKLQVGVGTYTHLISSFHIYLRDLPQAIIAFEDWVMP